MSKSHAIDAINIVLRCEVGSVAHGLSLGPSSDRDEMAVCIEPPERVIGLNAFDQWIFRTAEERAKHERTADQRQHGRTPRSQAGDLDLVVYSLRKWTRLAAQGNPTVLLLLFAKPLEMTPIGARLREQAEMFASREAGKRFLGYLKAQRQRLLGVRGQRRVTRTELVELHGFDSKFAAHAVRMGIQGVEYLSTGRLTLPMPEPDRLRCLAIRRGQWPLADVVHEIEKWETCLLRLLTTSPLPEHPDRERIDTFLVETYLECWAGRR